jgi:hypothetical protein
MQSFTACVDTLFHSIENVVGRDSLEQLQTSAAELQRIERVLRRSQNFCSAPCDHHSHACYQSQDPSKITHWVNTLCDQLESGSVESGVRKDKVECEIGEYAEDGDFEEGGEGGGEDNYWGAEEESSEEDAAPQLSDYEKMRLANIRRNELMLQVLHSTILHLHANNRFMYFHVCSRAWASVLVPFFHQRKGQRRVYTGERVGSKRGSRLGEKIWPLPRNERSRAEEVRVEKQGLHLAPLSDSEILQRDTQITRNRMGDGCA